MYKFLITHPLTKKHPHSFSVYHEVIRTTNTALAHNNYYRSYNIVAVTAIFYIKSTRFSMINLFTYRSNYLHSLIPFHFIESFEFYQTQFHSLVDAL
jgi:hypothetical protein